jgi:hypothetical protein
MAAPMVLVWVRHQIANVQNMNAICNDVECGNAALLSPVATVSDFSASAWYGSTKDRPLRCSRL